jgi:hypothetical protein
LKAYHLRSNPHLIKNREHWHMINLTKVYERLQKESYPLSKKATYIFLGWYKKIVSSLRSLMRKFIQILVKKYGNESEIEQINQSDFLQKIKEGDVNQEN